MNVYTYIYSICEEFNFRNHVDAKIQVSRDKRKIYWITIFLLRIKVGMYVAFIILFFLVGHIEKQILLHRYSF